VSSRERNVQKLVDFYTRHDKTKATAEYANTLLTRFKPVELTTAFIAKVYLVLNTLVAAMPHYRNSSPYSHV
jgi:hypothetical protein